MYAGAQKNFGTAGLTFVVVRDDVLNRVRTIKERTKLPFPPLMDWSLTAKQKDFFYNTPSLFSIYISHLMCEHMIDMGGLDYYEQLADKKSQRLYELFDESLEAANQSLASISASCGGLTDTQPLCYKNPVDKRLRSRMNVPFSLNQLGAQASKEMDKEMFQALEREGFCGLQGHRSLGGLRASLYNSIEDEHVVALCHFLKEQQDVHRKPKL